METISADLNKDMSSVFDMAYDVIDNAQEDSPYHYACIAALEDYK